MTETTDSGHARDDQSPEYNLPKDHWPLPALSKVEEHTHPSQSAYVTMQASEKFGRLRSSFRNFAFPTVVAVMVWYGLFVLLSVYAKGFMGQPMVGNLTIGMVIGLLQFPTTWFATWAYVRRANNVLDPLAKELREQIEAEANA